MLTKLAVAVALGDNEKNYCTRVWPREFQWACHTTPLQDWWKDKKHNRNGLHQNQARAVEHYQKIRMQMSDPTPTKQAL